MHKRWIIGIPHVILVNPDVTDSWDRNVRGGFYVRGTNRFCAHAGDRAFHADDQRARMAPPGGPPWNRGGLCINRDSGGPSPWPIAAPPLRLPIPRDVY